MCRPTLCLGSPGVPQRGPICISWVSRKALTPPSRHGRPKRAAARVLVPLAWGSGLRGMAAGDAGPRAVGVPVAVPAAGCCSPGFRSHVGSRKRNFPPPFLCHQCFCVCFERGAWDVTRAVHHAMLVQTFTERGERSRPQSFPFCFSPLGCRRG